MKNSFFFIHRDQAIPAEVVFNFASISDVMLVLPLTIIKDFDEYVLFARHQEQKWREETSLSIKFPDTFSDLIKRLTDRFKKENFSFHPNAVARW
ncbi:MAG: hypothetical protein QM731_13095 [Chitinophagaceae bacterium]